MLLGTPESQRTGELILMKVLSHYNTTDTTVQHRLANLILEVLMQVILRLPLFCKLTFVKPSHFILSVVGMCKRYHKHFGISESL